MHKDGHVMTEIIVGKRSSGKSMELIKKSAETGIYILVANRNRAKCLAQQACDMGYKMPYPVTLGEYMHGGFRGSCIHRDIRRGGIYIDDVDDVVKELFKEIEIKAITFTKRENVELPERKEMKE